MLVRTLKEFKKLLLLMALVSVSGMAQDTKGTEVIASFKLPGISIRAIEVVEDGQLWFAGSSGRYGRIIGNHLELDSISHQEKYPAFRSIAYNGKHIFLLSIESPALLYKIDPAAPLGNFELVYQETDPKAFYDSMAFFDTEHGLAVGDPTSNCLSVLRTIDGGDSWTKVSCDKLPDIVEGEAAFAASNTNIAIYENSAWLASGGQKARVFRTSDLGLNWKVSETPMVQGGKMTGIFSMDFFDGQNGIIMGGNWEEKKYSKNTKAISSDGGETWNIVGSNHAPGYISCVQYRPGGDGKELMAVSTEGIYYSKNSGMTWKKIGQNGFYSLRFINRDLAWLSVHEKLVKIKLDL
jgi:photosystem II stability/assembly factor-like uncharacterized protein